MSLQDKNESISQPSLPATNSGKHQEEEDELSSENIPLPDDPVPHRPFSQSLKPISRASSPEARAPSPSDSDQETDKKMGKKSRIKKEKAEKNAGKAAKAEEEDDLLQEVLHCQDVVYDNLLYQQALVRASRVLLGTGGANGPHSSDHSWLGSSKSHDIMDREIRRQMELIKWEAVAEDGEPDEEYAKMAGMPDAYLKINYEDDLKDAPARDNLDGLKSPKEQPGTSSFKRPLGGHEEDGLFRGSPPWTIPLPKEIGRGLPQDRCESETLEERMARMPGTEEWDQFRQMQVEAGVYKNPRKSNH